MSKIFEEYKRLKNIDNTKLYLFKCGKFYIFIDKDCDYINEYLVLKKVKLCNDVMKCGFPIDSLDNYLRVFKNHNLNVQIIDNIDASTIEELIKKIDINNITPMDALIKLKELQERCK